MLFRSAHLDKVRGYVDEGVREGAELLEDGRTLKVPGHENGFFLGPTLFDRVSPGMRIYQEEIFGPVLSVVRVPDYDSAVKLVNDHEYGNGAAIFTRDGDAARALSYFEQIADIAPDHPDVASGRVRALVSLGRLQDAEAVLAAQIGRAHV